MTRLSRTGIDYGHGGGRVGYAWNLWTGCSNTACPCRADCWALAMCRRYGWPQEPTLKTDYERVLRAPLGMTTPARFLVQFTSDFLDPKIHWGRREQIWCRVQECPRHQFLFLTKQYGAAEEFFGERAVLPNVWVGASICDYKSGRPAVNSLSRLNRMGWHTWLSVEPLLTRDVAQGIGTPKALATIEWMVVGALTRNGRTVGQTVGGTRPALVERLIWFAPEAGVGVWLKSNLEPIIQQVTDPRSGEPFRSVTDWQDPVGGKEQGIETVE